MCFMSTNGAFVLLSAFFGELAVDTLFIKVSLLFCSVYWRFGTKQGFLDHFYPQNTYFKIGLNLFCSYGAG